LLKISIVNYNITNKSLIYILYGHSSNLIFPQAVEAGSLELNSTELQYFFNPESCALEELKEPSYIGNKPIRFPFFKAGK
jgi:hypothetical protein